jgi:hypothetical protein
VEKGRTRISWERLGHICKILECRPSQIVALAEFLAEQDLRPDDEVLNALLAESTPQSASETCSRKEDSSTLAEINRTATRRGHQGGDHCLPPKRRIE